MSEVRDNRGAVSDAKKYEFVAEYDAALTFVAAIIKARKARTAAK
jgi:hypothetical protein